MILEVSEIKFLNRLLTMIQEFSSQMKGLIPSCIYLICKVLNTSSQKLYVMGECSIVSKYLLESGWKSRLFGKLNLKFSTCGYEAYCTNYEQFLLYCIRKIAYRNSESLSQSFLIVLAASILWD